MPDNYEYIDNYFNRELTAEENSVFEQRIIRDTAFAEEVALYCASIKTAADALATEKKTRFREIYRADGFGQKPALVKKLLPYISAAAIIGALLLGWFLISKPSNPQQLASRYIKDKLQTLPVTMSSAPDSIQAGLQLYNSGRLNEALLLFEKVIQQDSASTEPKEYAGIVSLRLGNYDQAIGYFQQLEAQTNLFTNPGFLYHAITLLKRNLPGDTEQAKQILKAVIEKNQEGKEVAAQLLEKL